MANRILKESICTSDDINALSLFEEVLFYRLIVSCDDYGRMDARPAILRARMFPLRPEVSLEMIGAALDTLARLGCVRRYAVDGRPYLCLTAWEAHQRVRNQRSKYPAPDGADDLPPSAAACGDAPPVSQAEAPSEALSQAQAEAEAPAKEVAAAAAALGLYGSKGDRAIARELVADYGSPWVAEALRRTAEGPARSWGYARGILRRWREAGGMDARGARPHVPTVNAQRYTQVAYTREELSRLVEAI